MSNFDLEQFRQEAEELKAYIASDTDKFVGEGDHPLSYQDALAILRNFYGNEDAAEKVISTLVARFSSAQAANEGEELQVEQERFVDMAAYSALAKPASKRPSYREGQAGRDDTLGWIANGSDKAELFRRNNSVLVRVSQEQTISILRLGSDSFVLQPVGSTGREFLVVDITPKAARYFVLDHSEDPERFSAYWS